MDKALVSNAADENQVTAAGKKMQKQRTQELNDLRTVLQSVSGRRLMWRLLEKSKTFESIWDSSSKIHYNAGRQDFGHFIMAEIIEADEGKLFQMMKEAKQKGEEKE